MRFRIIYHFNSDFSSKITRFLRDGGTTIFAKFIFRSIVTTRSDMSGAPS